MKEQSNQSQNPPAGKEHPEIYSVRQDKDGSFHISRRNFLYISAAIGGSLLLRGVCPRFGTNPAPSEPALAGMGPLGKVYIHAEPSIASNITETLQKNDYVRLISDHPDLGWVEVATQRGQHGWVKRSFVDFTRAIKSSTPNFSFSSTRPPTPTQTHPAQTFSIQLQGGENNQKMINAAGMAPTCGEAIQNGDFEGGSVSWVEESTGIIIRDDYPDPYQGSWVAWFGGPDAQEKLTQLFHVSATVQDNQTLIFFIKVTTAETSSQVYDSFSLRFLDAGGNPITSNDIEIADNTTPTDWIEIYVNLSGMTVYADQDIQIQFECVTDSSNDTSFVIDSVSLDLICEATPTETPTPTQPMYYVYLPVVIREAIPTPTSTPSPSATPCPSYDPCPSHCSSHCSTDCPSDCTYDCTYDCSSDCTFECIYDCTFDCIYDCSYDW